MWLLCLDDDWLLIDAGSAYPENEMLGIDMVIPDIEYLLENKDKLRGIVLTHAHLDHIGALPFLLSNLPLPVYGSPLTIAMTKHYLKMRDNDLANDTQFHIVKPDNSFKVGPVPCELLRMTHDIPDNCGVAVRTRGGWIVFSGDFKIDYTPLDGKPTNLARLGEMGREGVLCLLSDSSNAELAGSTFSEREMGKRLEQVIHEAEDRLVVHLGINDLLRVQQLLWLADQESMQVQIHSQALQDMITLAYRAGALQLPESFTRRNSRGRGKARVAAQARQRQLILTTSAMGEPYLSPLLGSGVGRSLIQKGDTVLLTGSAIPGSEKTQIRIVNNLYRMGVSKVVEVLSRGSYSSHAAQDELKLLMTLTRPRHVIPVHGEARQLMRHREIAIELGWKPEQVLIPANGECVDFVDGVGDISERIPVGKLLVDGLGVGDIGGVVLRDRKQLSEDGLLIAVLTTTRRQGRLSCQPEIVTRGFVYEPESDKLLEELRQKLTELVAQQNPKTDWSTLKSTVKDYLSKLVFERTHRRPVILPMVLEIRGDSAQR